MTEGDPNVFRENLEAFQTFWERKEPGFISYFKDYTMRTELVRKPYVTTHYSAIYHNISFIYLEKWTLAYSHFEHRDTDTNMLVER